MAKTHRAVIVDEGWRSVGIAAEISARIMEQAFYELDAPVERLCSAEVPMPYARHLAGGAPPGGTTLSQPSKEWCTPMAEFCMPSLGTDMEAGTLVEWLVHPGAHVKRGDIIAVVETEKGIIDIEVFETGVVERLLVEPGTKVPVGTVLAAIRTVGAPAAATAGGRAAASPVAAAEGAESQGQPSHAAPCPPEQPPRDQPSVPTTGKRQRISPLARKLAAELAIDLSTVHDSPEGTINRADVERAAAARQAAQPAPPPPAAAAEPLLSPNPRPACDAPSLPPWRVRTARSRTTTSRRAWT